MSLHIPEFLLLFGPVHSWWTFPFERMIGSIQRMPSNGKIGKIYFWNTRPYLRDKQVRWKRRLHALTPGQRTCVHCYSNQGALK
jgi:hypothetical protein